MDSRFFKYRNKLWVVFFLIVLIANRGIINYLLPLMDKTEARYAEIARIMVETNNWILLQIDYNIPFWAKPPLSTWLTAISIKAFGLHEFYIRLPYLITTMIIILFISKYDKIENKIFLLTPLILLLMPEFYLHAGVVSTDTILNFSIILVMLSFWEAVGKESRSEWWYGLFIGIGLGLLSKGPIILILTIPPILIWLLIYKEEFKKRGLDQLNLSRSLEDGGTLTSPLIPWNTCGAYMHSVLLVNPFDYVFYAFFNVINPILAVIYAYLGIKILRITPPHVEVNSKDTV